jgi:hypothetical protein
MFNFNTILTLNHEPITYKRLKNNKLTLMVCSLAIMKQLCDRVKM